MRVLRLCSVFEAPPGSIRRPAGLDVVGGMQIHTARLTTGLDRLGVAQTVLTACRRGGPRDQLIGSRSSVVRVGVPIGRFRQLYGLAAVPEIPRHPDANIVHVHLGRDLAVVPLARWAAARADVPLVVTIHCSLRATLKRHDARSGLLRSVGGRTHAWLLGRAAAILTVSEGSAMQLVASGVAPSRVRVLPMGIDAAVNAAPVRERRCVAYVGRLVREKGVVELLDAFTRVASDDTELVFVGDGPLRRGSSVPPAILRPATASGSWERFRTPTLDRIWLARVVSSFRLGSRNAVASCSRRWPTAPRSSPRERAASPKPCAMN